MSQLASAKRSELVRMTAAPLADGVKADIADVAKALGDPQRVEILHLLAVANEPVCVVDLEYHLGLAQSTVSHHLKVLVDAGVCGRVSRGRWSYYSTRADVLAGFRRQVERLVHFPAELRSGLSATAPGIDR